MELNSEFASRRFAMREGKSKRLLQSEYTAHD
jgi:hypothetical protein